MKKGLLFFMLLISVTITAQKVHTVKQGETLESIAKEYGTTIKDLKLLNPNADVVFVGLLLNVPTISQKKVNQSSIDNTIKVVDRIEMKDGSYVLCRVSSIKGTVATFEQDEIEGTATISTKDISLIEYANGKKRKFK